jgi:hypothetical protein
MARRKRKDEAPDWVPPEFDEVAYMRQEMEAGRASVATIVWAIVGSIVSFLLYSVFAPLAFLGGLAMGFGLYFLLPLFGIRTSAFKRRDWIGHGTIYFFSWLAFWIILLNPPFGDFTDPTINSISVSPYGAEPVSGLSCLPAATGLVSVPLSGGNDSLYILFRATDNARVASITVNVTPSPGVPFNVDATPRTGNSPCAGHESEAVLGGTYAAVVPLPFGANSIRVLILAVDPSGRGASAAFTVSIT